MSDILLIDYSSLGHMLWHAKSSEPNPNATSLAIVEHVRALASGQAHVGLALDSPPYFRSAISADYKATRDYTERAPLWHQMALALDTLKADGFPTFAVKGYEADDVLASVRHLLFLEHASEFEKVVIVSSDKDLFQLVHASCVLKSVRDGSIIDRDAVKAKTGVWPEEVLDWLVMVGDNSDNVKGMPGIGPKYAAGFIGEFGDLGRLYAAIDKGMTPSLTPLQRTKFQEFRAQWPITRSLIELRLDPTIDVSPLFAARVPVNADVVTFGDDDFVGFGHADMQAAVSASQANHPADNAVTFTSAPNVADSGAPQDILDDLRDVFEARTTTPAGKQAFADAVASGSHVPVVTAANGDMVNAITGEVLAHAAPSAASRASAEPPAMAQDRRESTGPAVADPAIPSTGDINAKREADAAPRAEGRTMVRDDALQVDQGHRPDDTARGGVSDGADRVRRDGSDRSDRGKGAADVAERALARDMARPEVLPAVSYERQLEPRSLSEAHMLAKAVAQGRLFGAYGSGEAVLTAIIMGRDLGFSVGSTLRAFHIVDSKPMLSADALRALVMKSGAAEYFRCTERSATKATFVTKRKDDPEPVSLTFTIEEGKAAWPKGEEQWSKSAWGKNPADMLVARASSKLARLVYADIVLGIYANEEID